MRSTGSRVTRFLREVELAARLDHPAIVRVFEVVHDGDRYGFAMEFVAGAPLDRVCLALEGECPDRLTRSDLFGAVAATCHRPVTRDAAPVDARGSARTGEGGWIPAVVEIAVQVAGALGAAHRAGVIHRDVKPADILVRPDGAALLTDFGLAQVDGLPSTTATGEFAGTPYYVSPEQAMAKRVPVDHRTDVFSLGVVLYELLTLQRPFPGDSSHEVLARIITKEPADPRRHNAQISSRPWRIPGSGPAPAGFPATAMGATSPSARAYHAMAYDSQRDKTVLFGGMNGSSAALATTWEWDGTAWSKRTPATSPPARWQHAMAYDAARGRVVLFGGFAPLRYFGDTWEWDGTTWTERTPASGPPARYGHAMTYDSARGRVVLFGGLEVTGVSASTWEWDGTNWTQRVPSTSQPPARMQHALAYDSKYGRVLLFGGIASNVALSDTWDYGPVDPASAASFGAGCPGSAGVPSLAASLPWLGETLRYDLASLPSNTSALLVFGASKCSWGSIGLPLSLNGLRMSGCALYVSIDVTVPVAAVGNTASVFLTLPNDPRLLGGEVFNQALVVDVLANPAGISWSNATDAIVGAK